MLGICSSWARTRPDRSAIRITPRLFFLFVFVFLPPAAGFLFLRARPPEEERYLASASWQSVRVSGTLSSSPFCIPSPPPKCTAFLACLSPPAQILTFILSPFLCLILALYICPVLLFLTLKLCCGLVSACVLQCWGISSLWSLACFDFHFCLSYLHLVCSWRRCFVTARNRKEDGRCVRA